MFFEKPEKTKKKNNPVIYILYFNLTLCKYNYYFLDYSKHYIAYFRGDIQHPFLIKFLFVKKGF